VERGIVTAPGTELQVWQRALIDLVADARASMNLDVYVVWVEFLCSIAAHESVRCVNWKKRAA
jgi:hypothetical protein